MSHRSLKQFGIKPVTGFSPLSIPWVDAYWASDPSWTPPADGGAVSTWRDAGTRALAAVQATGANQPLYRAAYANLNSKPAVEFDGINDILTSATGTAVSQPYDVVCVAYLGSVTLSGVVACSVNSTNDRCIGWAGLGTWRSGFGTATASAGNATTGKHFFHAGANGASSVLDVDGSNVISASAGTDQWNANRIGARASASEQTTGAIAFVGVIDRALTTQEKSDLLAWSQSTYGTP